MRPLSFSSISLYEECPKKWHFKYVEGIPEKPRHFFSFGKTMHDALEFLYDVKTLPPPSLDEVLEHYRKNWISEGYKDAKQEEDYKAQGELILREYYEKNIKVFRIPYFTEYAFNLDVDGVQMRGFVDRVDKIGDDRIEILDYKTGKAIPLSRVKTDDQLTMYQMACEELLGLKVDKLTFYHLPSQTALTAERRDQEKIKALRGKIVRVASAIKAEEFPVKPNERRCGWCDFQPLCPAWRHQFASEEPRSEKPPAAVRTDEKLAKLVDRYGKMKEEIRERETKAEELKESIVATLKEKGYVRAFGGRYEATAHLDERWEFHDRKKVIDTIQRAGFWERIIAPSAPAVQKLMKDPNLPLDLRDRLQKLGQKIEHSVLRIKKIEEEE